MLTVLLLFTLKEITMLEGTYHPHNEYRDSILTIMMDTTTFVVPDMFDVVIEFVLKHEGDRYVHDLSINEVSRMGITLATYRHYYGKGNSNSIKNITKEEATEIYKNLFWKANNLDSISNIGFTKTAIALMDSEVNIGPNRANKYLQRIIGVKRTGVIDDDTLSKLRDTKITDDDLCSTLIQTRKNFYARLVARDTVYVKYHKGWNNRLDDMKDFVEEI